VELRIPSGRTAREIVVRDAAQLRWMVNLGCIDLNPHPVRADDLEHPDELRLDLDPGPGVSWDFVRRVTLLVRDVLDEHGLRGWLRSSSIGCQRSFNMSRIRGRDTKPELLLRRGLHARGFRFRLHRRDLPGRPDLVFPAKHAVVLIHGCFWHGMGMTVRCAGCPATRADFWRTKIEKNRARDRDAATAMRKSGWRVLTVWECALRGPASRSPAMVVSECEQFLQSGTAVLWELEGNWEKSRAGGNANANP
jgi:DNA mismatch endonuclease (patch repair protein)